jgi:hypothetical protein
MIKKGNDMSEHNIDPELRAIEQVMQALGSLKAGARARVVAYVFERLGLSAGGPVTSQSFETTTLDPSAIPPSAGAVQDIRTLKNSKNPKTDNEMATLVAYYLKHLAPPDERKDAISRDEIEKYFVQADYPLPKQPQLALPNAKNAGYFDQAGRGLYKLNPVGHNLVTHGLAENRSERKRPTTRRKTTRRTGRKSTKKK